MLVELLLLVVAVALFWHAFLKRPPNFPPGLPRLPVVGSSPFLRPNLYQVIKRNHKKYNGIFSFYLGKAPTVVVTDYNIYKQASIFQIDVSTSSSGNNLGILFPLAYEKLSIIFLLGHGR